MNKSLIVLPFILGMFMALSLNAQLGIKAGINLANLSYDPESSIYSTTVKPGISVGAFYNLRLSDRFALQPEVDYIQHGAKTEYTLGNTTSKSNSSYTINYLQIPVLLKMRLVNSLYAQAGPYVGKGLGKAKNELTDADGNKTVLESEFTEDGVNGPKEWDYGFQVGAGFSISSRARIDARYIHGLATVSESVGTKTFNRGYNLNLSFYF
ncbi:MAG: PorT family protein [Saprospiraceae bacterium]|nr:MAG: membrane protein [Bacteroidetes bacterium OLB9]MCO6463141.1 PorT family protein [Saprospiraceae bacterium]MCZ2337902.1 PorT family protein [Chitinophagales bacterium]